MMKTQKGVIYGIIVLCVVLLALVLRAWKLDTLLPFGNLEARDARVVMDMLNTWEPEVLGPQITDTDLYLGPVYYYIAAPFYFLLLGDPLAGSLLALLAGVAATGLAFRVGRRMFGRVGGIAAGTFMAVLLLLVQTGRWGLHPHILPLFVLLFIYGLWLMRVRTEKWTGRAGTGLEIAVFSLCIAIQLHITALALVVPLLVVLLVVRPKIYIGEIFVSVALVVALFSPLLYYEYHSDFSLSRASIEWVTQTLTPGDLSYGERFSSRGAELLLLVGDAIGAVRAVWVGGVALVLVIGLLLFGSLKALPEQGEGARSDDDALKKRDRAIHERFTTRLLLTTLTAQLVPLLVLPVELESRFILGAIPICILAYAYGARLLWTIPWKSGVLAAVLGCFLLPYAAWHVYQLSMYIDNLAAGAFVDDGILAYYEYEDIRSVLSSLSFSTVYVAKTAVMFDDALIYVWEQTQRTASMDMQVHLVERAEEADVIIRLWDGETGVHAGRFAVELE